MEEAKTESTGKTLEDLQKNPLYGQITPKMQTFVSMFCTNGYKLVPAVMSAYTCKDLRSAESQGRNLLRNWKIRRLISFMGDYSMDGAFVTRKEICALISDRLRDPKTPAVMFYKLWEMLKEVRGGIHPAAQRDLLSPAEEKDVDALVRDLEAKARAKK